MLHTYLHLTHDMLRCTQSSIITHVQTRRERTFMTDVVVIGPELDWEYWIGILNCITTSAGRGVKMFSLCTIIRKLVLLQYAIISNIFPHRCLQRTTLYDHKSFLLIFQRTYTIVVEWCTIHDAMLCHVLIWRGLLPGCVLREYLHWIRETMVLPDRGFWKRTTSTYPCDDSH